MKNRYLKKSVTLTIVATSVFVTACNSGVGNIANQSQNPNFQSQNKMAQYESYSTLAAISEPYKRNVLFKSISNASSHSCAIGVDGQGYCWGVNYDGEVGIGERGNLVAIPTAVIMPEGASSFTSISNTYLRNCAIGDNGKAYCWGAGYGGETGTGQVGFFTKPTAVVMPSKVASFTSISVGRFNTCALDNKGKAYCWGGNVRGELGNGTNLPSNVPEPVLIRGGISLTSISNSFFDVCALDDEGNAYCWGAGETGLIGNGENTDANIPKAVVMPPGVKFTSIAMNFSHNCAIGNNGKVYCWGAGAAGQIGNGENTGVNIPTAVIMPEGVTNFTFLLNNDSNGNTCAIGNDGNVYCWGNQYGNIPRLLPKPSGMNKFVVLSGGTGFKCALDNDGKAACWGYGSNGALGNGKNADSAIPTPVVMPAGVTFTSISFSNDITHGICAIGSNSRGYCWGSNGWGVIGDGDTINVNVPTEFYSHLRVSQPMGGYLTSCRNDKNIPAWEDGILTQRCFKQSEDPYYKLVSLDYSRQCQQDSTVSITARGELICDHSR